MTNDELAQHLAAIRTAAGGLTPDAVVNAAADPKHPMHNHFEWDDTEAAESWRRQQARMLIARVRVIVSRTTKNGMKDVEVRRYASVEFEGGPQYIPVGELTESAELAVQVLDRIRKDLAGLRRKYAAYGDLFAAVIAEAAGEEDQAA